MSLCPCGSSQDYDVCCAPFHKGEAAPTAEKLMRARYAAFEKGQIDYLASTLTEESRVDFDSEETANWASSAIWKKLEIVKTTGGQENDDEGTVEFKAYFKLNKEHQVHHEISTFTKTDGAWYYVSGDMNPKQEQRIVLVKAGRNDPCPCSSGKKYKKCCGA
jgi:SEC-C motif domain protein